jgi:hypothetical protein
VQVHILPILLIALIALIVLIALIAPLPLRFPLLFGRVEIMEPSPVTNFVPVHYGELRVGVWEVWII